METGKAAANMQKTSNSVSKALLRKSLASPTCICLRARKGSEGQRVKGIGSRRGTDWIESPVRTRDVPPAQISVALAYA
jgi:hypothetical protein